MEATYSIQGVDFSMLQEGDVKSATQVIDIFNTHDWASEIAQQTRCEIANEDHCPAGLSIVREPSVFLHICPLLDGMVQVHCVHTMPVKRLGIFKSQKRTNLFAERLQKPIAIQAVTKFLAADNDWLLANIRED